MSSIQERDQGYRRGLVLGFTMAEIAILMIFVLLLVLSILLGRKSKEVEDLKEWVANLELNTSEELIRLKKLERTLNLAAPEDMREQPLPEVFRELVFVRQEIVAAGIQATPNALQQVLKDSALAKKALAELAGQDGNTLVEKNAGLVRENDNLKSQIANLRRRAGAGGRGLDHPPCWATPDGRTEYIFDVVLTSRGLILHDRETPPGRINERNKLPLDGFVFNKELSPELFSEITKPLYDWSIKQSPECRFVVRAIDTTGPTEKALYKRHMRVLEHHFYKYEQVKASL